MKTPAFVLAVVLVSGVAFAQGAGSRVPPQKPCGATGEILAINHTANDKSIELKTLNGETTTYKVDEDAVPRFWAKYNVGDRVTVTCKSYPERGYFVYDIQEEK